MASQHRNGRQLLALTNGTVGASCAGQSFQRGSQMDVLLRCGAFLGVCTTVMLWEFRRPRRPLPQLGQERWVANLGLTLPNMVRVRLTVGGGRIRLLSA
jgi:hypothetical protein